MAIEISRLLFLQMPAVGQQDAAQFPGRFAGIDRSAHSIPNQGWQITTMIKMRVSQYRGLNRRRGNGKRSPVPESQHFVALKQSAIDEQAAVIAIHEVARTGNRSRCAGKCEFHLGPRSMGLRVTRRRFIGRPQWSAHSQGIMPGISFSMDRVYAASHPDISRRVVARIAWSGARRFDLEQSYLGVRTPDFAV